MHIESLPYVVDILDSRLPLAPWMLPAVWVMLFAANHLLASWLRASNARNVHVAVENPAALSVAARPRRVLAQVLFAASLFTFAFYAGGAPFVFFAGGLDVSTACVAGLNLQALLASRAMQRPGASEGTIRFSNAFALEQMASRMLGVGASLALCGALLGHLALLGGAFFCLAAGIGFGRRARA